MRKVYLFLFFFIFVVGGYSLAACTTNVPTTEETASEQQSEVVKEAGQEATPEAPAESVAEPMPEPAPEMAEATPEQAAEPTPEAQPEGQPEFVPGEKIEAPAEQWTWVDFPDTKCGYGSPTGLGVNIKPGATRLLIYLQGGGACWMNENPLLGGCFGRQVSASNLGGFGKSNFDTLNKNASIFFRRDAPTNVFADAHMVFIPYCTGDVYAGDREVDFGGGRVMHFHGHRNMVAYLKRLVPTFGDVQHVVFSGSSAGGFGAAINWELVQNAFGAIPVDVLDDAGHPMDPAPGRWEEWRDMWMPKLPPSCADCTDGVSKILDHYDKTILAKGRKMGLLTNERDAVIRAFFNYLDLTGDLFKAKHDVMLDRFDQIPNAQFFALTGDNHTMFGSADRRTSKDGVALVDWVRWMVEGDARWVSQRP